MEFDLFTFIAQLVNFIVLVWILNKLLFKKILSVMDERQKKVNDELEHVKKLAQQAEEREKELAEASKQISKQHESKILEMTEEVTKLRQNLERELKEEIMEARNYWSRKIEQDRNFILTRLSKRMGEILLSRLQHLFRDLANEKMENQIVEKFASQLGSLTIPLEISTPLTIKSSFELDSEQKNLISGLVKKKFGDNCSTEFHLDPSSLCGVEIVLAGKSFGWHLEEYLEQLQDELDNFQKQLAVHSADERK